MTNSHNDLNNFVEMLPEPPSDDFSRTVSIYRYTTQKPFNRRELEEHLRQSKLTNDELGIRLYR